MQFSMQNEGLFHQICIICVLVEFWRKKTLYRCSFPCKMKDFFIKYVFFVFWSGFWRKKTLYRCSFPCKMKDFFIEYVLFVFGFSFGKKRLHIDAVFHAKSRTF